ncbi:hypothetical protein CO018_00305 [Candidatus Beckwithbacteria bacterium CG_4_9_14_0_2_um_filter_47_11]|uniref:Type II secretion system protein GspG C-terminal domain-containing protein n=1 Tax=Candidatus Beckwithbacteria bacterium CG_4_9_14_0_2_um_filter_47_11 TaxID=1974494 RepID=A0A2M8G587_9BACT|nr:MAG: hypothetical protein CO018_00305 [Candidatus Beckwithbacteria bacterium CG_4_9_14_0_2_um_filter_47_11]
MNKKGFTLIELIVVIAIIGTLTGLIVNNLNDARARARDAKRKQDLGSFKTALRLYYNDNQTYPANLSVDLTDYIKVMPEYDTYTQDDSGNGFTLKVTLENLSDPDLAASQARCPGNDANSDYVVCAD